MVTKICCLISKFCFGAILFFMVSCEGPAGLPGEDANESCKLCHNPNVVDLVSAQYELSKHARGDASFTETGNVSCAPCHESTGFKFVCTNNIPATFTLNSATGKYVNDYFTSDSTTYGTFTCNTCHSNLHKSYDKTDFYPFTTTAPVNMTMWAGAKTIDITQENSKSNLCIKCHQPRPATTSSTLSDGNIVDYTYLVAHPSEVYYDSAVGNAKPNKLIPSYRTGIHYGSVGAIFAGKGGVEFTGSVPSYESSEHTSTSSCQDCHMAKITGGAGGHTFNAKGNFGGCNVSGCHSDDPMNSTSSELVNVQNEIRTLLELLASKLKSGGVEILHQDPDVTTNLWYGITTKNYDGNLNIYDPSSNPGGTFQNPAPAKTWTTGQITTNKALRKFTSLKDVQLGAILNFQLCLRDYSLGVHNYAYAKALLTNSIDALTVAGF